MTQLEYSVDGTTLLKCVDAHGNVCVPEGCQVIGPRAFMYQEGLESIELPSSLERIEDFAFSDTGLTRFDAPEHLKCIGPKAFFKCASLERVVLNDELREIGEDAFSATMLEELELPASLEELGRVIALDTPMWWGKPGAMRIGFANERFLIDDSGGVYRKTPDGLVLQGVSTAVMRDHHVLDETTVIGPRAYKGLKLLESVDLPEGLVEIGEEAFRACALKSISLPDTLEVIGARAFYDAGVTSLMLPASLHELGADALLAGSDTENAISRLSVAEDSEHFYIENDVLCERGSAEDGGDLVRGFFGSSSSISIPKGATALAPHSITRCEGVSEIRAGTQVRHVPSSALIGRGFIDKITIELDEPYDEDGLLVLHFPQSKGMRLLLGINLERSGLDPETLAGISDEAAPSIRDMYERSSWLLARLERPLYMKEGIRELFLAYLQRDLMSLCELFAQRGDLKGFSRLAEENVLNKDTIGEAVEVVASVGDAAATAHMLGIKKRLGTTREALTI